MCDFLQLFLQLCDFQLARTFEARTFDNEKEEGEIVRNRAMAPYFTLFRCVRFAFVSRPVLMCPIKNEAAGRSLFRTKKNSALPISH